MKTVLLYILISISQGTYNEGNLVVIDRFPTLTDCEDVIKQTVKGWDKTGNRPTTDILKTNFYCLRANVVREN